MTSTFKERRLFSRTGSSGPPGDVDLVARTTLSGRRPTPSRRFARSRPPCSSPRYRRSPRPVYGEPDHLRIAGGHRAEPDGPDLEPVFRAPAFRTRPETGSSRPRRPAGSRGASHPPRRRRPHHPKEIPSGRSGSHPASLLLLPRYRGPRARTSAFLQFGGGERPPLDGRQILPKLGHGPGPVSTTSTCGLARQKRSSRPPSGPFLSSRGSAKQLPPRRRGVGDHGGTAADRRGKISTSAPGCAAL